MAQGDGQTLQEAFENAWRRVPAAAKRKMHTAKIQVWGNNPINGYRVILSATQEDPPT
jgi:hypothetical protein